MPFLLLAFVALSVLGGGVMRADPFFVDPDAPAGGDGLSWATAFNNLPEAVASADNKIRSGAGAAAGETAEIWVKAGFIELNEALSAPRGFSGIQLYGGFAGTEIDPNERTDIHGENATVLLQNVSGERILDLSLPPDAFVHFQSSSEGTVTVSWSSVVGELYYVEHSEALEGPWEQVTDLIEATDTTTEVVLTDAEGGFYRVLRQVADPVQMNVRVDGFTLTGARDVDGIGGAMIIEQAASSVVIANCRIVENSSLQFGGGVAVMGTVDHPSEPTFINTEISNNLSTAVGLTAGGGGIHYTAFGGGTMQSCVVSGNRADGNRGGGIHRLGAEGSPSLLITNTRISNNSSHEAGGGISALGPITLRQSVISGNTLRDVTAEARGGAGLKTFASNAHVEIDRSIISGNRLVGGDGGRGGGGGIQFRTAGTISVTNSIISGNQVTGALQTRGGGIYFRESTAGATMANNTIAENFIGGTSGGNGGAVNVRDGAVTFNNNLFALNNDTGINVWHQGQSVENSNLYFGNENRGENDAPDGNPRFVSEGENAVTGTWANVGAFEGNELTGRGTTLMVAEGTPFAGLSLAGTLVNPNTEQKRQALILSHTDSELLLEGDIGEEYGVSEGMAFKLINYRIEQDSEAIGAADPALATGHDFLGTRRPQGVNPDIGAFEFFIGDVKIMSFGRVSPDMLELVFFTPFPDDDHIVQTTDDLVAGDWEEQPEVVMTAIGNDVFEARFPMGEGSRGFYRVGVTAPQPIFYDDFEDGAPGWTHGGANDSWALGVPTSGPGEAQIGENVWATNLNGTYMENSDAWLRSPAIDLSDVSTATLSFWEWRHVDSNIQFHRTIVRVLDAGTLVEIEELSRRAGTSDGWVLRTLSLGEESVGRPVVIEFRLQSDEFNMRDGWYIDGVMMEPR